MGDALEESEATPGSLWEQLKTKLDEELVPDQIDQMKFLLKDKIINREVYPHLKTPSDILTYLENNMATDEAWTVVEHTFGTTKDHFIFANKSIADMINECRQTRAFFTCSTFVGREQDLIDVLSKFRTLDYIGVWIHGIGGLGKTLLAREICATLSKDIDIVIVDMKQVNTALDFVRQILTFVMNIMEASSDIDELLQYIVFPKDHKQLIVLDNIEDVYLRNETDTIKVLNRIVDKLPDSIKCLITCRVPPNQDTKPRLNERVAIYELTPLSAESSKTLLELRAKPSVVPTELLNTISEKTNGNPYAICLIGSAIKQSPKDLFAAVEFINFELGKIQKMPEILEYTYKSLNEATQHKLLQLSVVGSAQFDCNIASAIFEAGYEETVMTMLELTNRHVIQRQHWDSFKSEASKGRFEICYCIHPLVLHFLESKQTEDNMIRARKNFCLYVFEVMDKECKHLDINYSKTRESILESQGVYKSLFKELGKYNSAISDRISEERCIYLSKLMETLQTSEEDKNRLYKNLILESTESCSMFWRSEYLAHLIDSDQLNGARAVIDDIEKHPDWMEMNIGQYTIGNVWYHNSRLLRKTEKYEDALRSLEKAMCCFKNIESKTGIAQTFNAMGNVYFNKGELENAKKAHEAARNVLGACIETDHPDLSVYDFNIGTIYKAIADQKHNAHVAGEEEVKVNYEMALNMFQMSLRRDQALGQTKSSQYPVKLDNTALCHFHLGQYDAAIKTMQEVVDTVHSTTPSRTTLLIYFSAGKTFMDWLGQLKHEQAFTRDSKLHKELITEAGKCFTYLHNTLEDHHPNIDLNIEDKADFIKYYRKLAENFPRERSEQVKDFCKRYERGSLEASESSSDSSDSSSVESSDNSPDEGALDDDYTAPTGIQFVEMEKIEASRFNQNFKKKVDLASVPKKRCHSSSESDE